MTEISNLISKANRIACIGSSKFRNDDDEKTCQIIGYFIAHNNIELASGNAVGCDYAFATGANKVNENLVHLFLVNKNHNINHIKPGNHLYYENEHPEWSEIAKKNHPGYNNQSDYVQKLFNRNAGIILNSDLVIALPNPDKTSGGGTGHSIRIANELNIPVINLLDDDVIQNLKLLMRSHLLREKLNGRKTT